MKIIREISVYEKSGDNLIESFEVDLSIKDMLKTINPDMNDDPNLFKVYPLSEKQYKKLMEIEAKLKNVDFQKCDVFYECSELI